MAVVSLATLRRIRSITLLLVLVSSSLFSLLAVAETDDYDDNSEDGDLTLPLREDDRVEEFHRRNYTWPPSRDMIIPKTEGWQNLVWRRLQQVAEMDVSKGRYVGYMQTLASGVTVPNFTEYGFGLARCPDDLLAELRETIYEGLPNVGLEYPYDVIGPQPWFIGNDDLANRVLHELHGLAEAWAGIELIPHLAYGFRLYRNTSSLPMHLDNIHTHVVSFILHIGSSDDSEPWPIFIEDFHGRTHEVVLTPGDLLFYESAKCFHGRPKPFHGTWYTSVFVHYYPKNGWSDVNHELETHFVVSPDWDVDIPDDEKQPQLNALEMVTDTAFLEPDCPNSWCATTDPDRVQWSGPAEEGFVMAPNFQKYPIHYERIPYTATTIDEL